MQISDFLQRYLSDKATIDVAYSMEMTTHLDGYLQQIWPAGRILLVTESFYREYAEHTLVPALISQGYDPLVCVCFPQAGNAYLNQIKQVVEKAQPGISRIASLGSAALFATTREMAAILNIPCCAMLNELMSTDGLDAYGEQACAEAVFFDLDAISKRCRGDFRSSVQSLEISLYALKADIEVHHAMGIAVSAGVLEAIDEAMPPRLLSAENMNEDEIGQLCEACIWRTVAVRLFHHKDSFQTILDYAKVGREFTAFSAVQHAQIVARIFDAALEMESLEISPDDCAMSQPPKEILSRTLQQILLEDGLPATWLKRAEAAYQDRSQIRAKLHAVMLNWDDFCARLRPIADMLHAICAQYLAASNEEPDPQLQQIWLHASMFAPQHTFLRLFHDMRIIEPALYV